MKPTLLVMAAGIGSRYGGIKQIEPVGLNGESIVDFSVYDAARSGFASVVFVIRRDIEADMRRLTARFEHRLPVRFAFQELTDLPPGFSVPEGRTKPWGTGQAVLCARGLVREPFAVINADDFYGREAFAVMAGHLSSVDPRSTDYAMVGYELRNTLSEHGGVSRALCETTAHGYLSSLEEHLRIEKRGQGAVSRLPSGDRDLSGGETVSMNFFGFTPELFAQLDGLFRTFLAAEGSAASSEFFIPKAAGSLLAAGRASMRVLRCAAAWFGVTYKEDLSRVRESIRSLVQTGAYPRRLWD